MAGVLSYVKDPELTKPWLIGYWPTIPLSLSALYLLMVYLLKRWMEGRKPMKLRTPLIVWNACLATFSVVTFIRFAPPGLLKELTSGGFIHSVCLVTPFSTPELNLWSTLFILSKFIEFGDTFFLIFRKSPLTFLHVYHHVTIAVYTWFGGTDRSSIGHWFCAMNYGVHSIMYTYFLLKVIGVRLRYQRQLQVRSPLCSYVSFSWASCVLWWLQGVCGWERRVIPQRPVLWLD